MNLDGVGAQRAAEPRHRSSWLERRHKVTFSQYRSMPVITSLGFAGQTEAALRYYEEVLGSGDSLPHASP